MTDLDELRSKRRQRMPSSRDVVQETLDRLQRDLSSPDYVRKNFNALLQQLFTDTLKVLEDYEQRVDIELLREAGFDLSPAKYRLLRDYFLSVSQSRKQRGGKDFELQVQKLLEKADIPFEAQTKKERVDLVLPSQDLWNTDRARAVLISLKRTLRERWRQVADELYSLRCPNTYLLTADSSLPKSTVQHIFTRNIYLVVWDSVKNDFGNHRVLSISELMYRLCNLHMPNWSLQPESGP
jgi:hypothetical protein